MNSRTIVSVSLPPSLADKLASEARKQEKTTSRFVRDLIEATVGDKHAKRD